MRPGPARSNPQSPISNPQSPIPNPQPPASGGTRVTIQGSAFVDGTAVFFGAVPASDIAVVDSTVITAKTPPYPEGQATVMLRGPDGSETVFPVPFTYMEMAEDTDGDAVSDAQEIARWTMAVDLCGFGADHPRLWSASRS